MTGPVITTEPRLTHTVQFFVPGKAAAQGSKRHVGRGILVESSKEVGPWRERVALAAHQVMDGTGSYIGPVRVTVRFVMPRPKSAPKTRYVYAAKRPDLDKLVRAILDAITDVCIADDAQVVELIASKELASSVDGELQVGAHITVQELP